MTPEDKWSVLLMAKGIIEQGDDWGCDGNSPEIVERIYQAVIALLVKTHKVQAAPLSEEEKRLIEEL